MKAPRFLRFSSGAIIPLAQEFIYTLRKIPILRNQSFFKNIFKGIG